MKYGFYSAQAAATYGTIIYKTPEGGTVHITGIFDDREAKIYRWEDKKFVGMVTDRVGDGRKPTENPRNTYDSVLTGEQSVNPLQDHKLQRKLEQPVPPIKSFKGFRRKPPQRKS